MKHAQISESSVPIVSIPFWETFITKKVPQNIYSTNCTNANNSHVETIRYLIYKY